ncbi:AraC family transcriptional regulator [Leptospira selangorensis]|uniref:AraC family transcriptional regulator n=1 Tax=Leptospira selangorensis TaxID=2484982 RepID=A0A5F2BWH3_9LEPT|nr:AraC family transcriptional regulator [Leptospira selangorensis]TGM13169.1 AraC family transcriptional regulator [Leptospira selangorensis]TGM15364.1 AraC family transcriptional regulator [Leptospira selangorensis]
MNEFGTQSYTSLFLAFSIGLAFLFSLGEIFSSPRGEKQNLLAIIFFLVGIFLTHAFLLTCKVIIYYPGLYLTHLPVSGLMGPFIERYLLLAMGNTPESKKIFYLKMLPALAIFLWMSPFYFSGGPEKIEVLKSLLQTGLPLFLKIPVLSTMGVMFVFLLSTFFRLFWGFRLSVIYKDPRMLTILGVSICILIIILYGFVSVSIGSIRGLEGVGSLIGIFLCALYILRQGFPEFFLEVQRVVEEEKKYRATQLGGLDLENIKQSLESLFQKEKVFLKEDLTLGFLAGKLEISTHQLSEYLNNEIGKNFFQLLNEYRVEEAKKKIESDPQEVLLSIAYSSGFGSKSAFNEVFRKETGFTPSEYRNKIRKNKSK